MSSSRSIAAARNRRAGGDPQPTSRTRPNTSIASQGAFSQQQQPMQQNRKMNTNNAPQQVQSTNKISISDAIGLITIRLGRLEQFIHESQEKGDFSFSGSENLQLIDKEVIQSLTERIYMIENKPSQNQLTNPSQLLSQLAVLEKEVKHLKEFLGTHNDKMNNFISETEQKFIDVDTAFVELEKNLQTSEVKTDSENIQLDVEESEKEDEKPPTFSSVDLKNVIEEELANAEI